MPLAGGRKTPSSREIGFTATGHKKKTVKTGLERGPQVVWTWFRFTDPFDFLFTGGGTLWSN